MRSGDFRKQKRVSTQEKSDFSLLIPSFFPKLEFSLEWINFSDCFFLHQNRFRAFFWPFSVQPAELAFLTSAWNG